MSTWNNAARVAPSALCRAAAIKMVHSPGGAVATAMRCAGVSKSDSARQLTELCSTISCTVVLLLSWVRALCARARLRAR